MITCKLYGRFGNQLFQMAATIGHAVKHSYSWAVPHDTIDNGTWAPHPFTHLPKYSDGANRIWKEPAHYYNEIPAEDGLILDGYFQSYRYFEHCIDEVRNLFRISTLNNIPYKDVLAIHFRHGDYALYPDKHPILPIDTYYIPAIEKIIQKRELKSIICSIKGDLSLDEINEAMNSISKAFKRIEITYVSGGDIDDYLTDFYDLCVAKNLIIANSSFSLMAGILNRNPDRLIIAPDKRQYFGIGNAHLDTRDIYPDDFFQIPY